MGPKEVEVVVKKEEEAVEHRDIFHSVFDFPHGDKMNENHDDQAFVVV